ncbi:hypothetical protein [Cytophaga hutchinsonii]|jgi:hypothetical protein|uniref:Uncharacterized protein n=1 Tax=Cytophaga hutchinsonii (strain ATCC 33406 / DSM 1761 / CIP 103989 / NBRC 15051 / NCIMB 9469 / D465) TaxID=269798 RepID=A0A6N4SUH3_CYTH3|nr:hypothetical protein [Cytophaga hutchinsonii]ABG59873.1 hypothetical protein CHU_2621 [Cytophaga hutchinsonii ATCC 33406]SFX28334.1 hypothetical protein SAMN04487930_102431 [Cytophaga hutchinsonii ATCC 33406]
MATSIKQKLHTLIDTIDNESLLTQVYELIYKKSSSKEGDLWNKLTSQQQQEVLLSLEESNDTNNLISNDDVKKSHKKWL